MDLSYACTVEGNAGCATWTQTGITGSKDEPDAFKVSMGLTCRDWSDKGYCKAWSHTGSAIKEGGSGCFPGSTLVLTSRGPMPMSKLSIGDELLGMDATTGNVVSSHIRAWLHREVETEMEMTVLSTEAGRIIASHKHSIATDRKRYIFADELTIGDALWTPNGTQLTVRDKSRESHQGLYSPLTTTSNYFAGASEHSMVLVHNFAHLWQPELFAGPLHVIFDVAEWFWPHLHDVKEDDKRYVHPIMKLLAPLIGIHL